MLTLIIKKSDDSPIYEQLYLSIRKSIENGYLKSDEKLPSKRKLALHLEISTITVENAYSQLLAEGYIYSVPKKGYYVQENLPRFFPRNSNNQSLAYYSNSNLDVSDLSIQYDFKTNIVDTSIFPFSTWAKTLREVVSENAKDLLNLTNPKGLLELRREISKHLSEYRGILATPEQIIVGSGSEYIYNLLIQILGRNITYGYEDPGYDKIKKIFKANEVNTVYIPLDINGLNISELKKLNPKVVHVTPSHQFPSGIVTPITRRQKLLQWANNATDRYIIEDDYDSEFRFTGSPIPAMQRLDNNQKVIYINSFTKSIAPSIRISYMVLPMHLVNIFDKNFAYLSSTVSNFDQYTLCRFMQKGHFERHLFRAKKLYKERRDTLIDSLTKSLLGEHIKILGADGGLHLVIEINSKHSEKKFIDSALQNGVKVYGISKYYENTEHLDKTSIILGFSGLSNDEIKSAIILLEKSWEILL